MTGRRVLWVTERYPPAKGGMAVSCARQVRGLRRRGVIVDVLTMERGAAPLLIEPHDNGTDLRVGRDLVDAMGPNLAWTTVAERHARETYACTVGFGASWAGFVAATFGAWLNAGAAVLIRGNDLDRDWFLPRRGGWVREALARVSAVGAVSPEKAQRVARLYPGKLVRWTPNGIDAARWRLLPADQTRRDEVRALLKAKERRVIGLFGDLKAKKRVTLWLEAVRDAGLLDGLALLIVGQVDPLSARILDDRALAPPNVRIPFSPPAELPALYAACDFVALPSSFDGMPNVLLEAMASGVPPIASNAGAMAQIVTDGETGFLFPAENRDAAGAATRRALALSPEQARAMGERARHAVATRFTLDREIDALVELLSVASA